MQPQRHQMQRYPAHGSRQASRAGELIICAVLLCLGSQAQSQKDKTPDVLYFQFDRHGFSPKVLTYTKGLVIISVLNTTLISLSLTLDRQNGEHLSANPVKERKRFSQLYNLTPGTYILKDVNHPEWASTITIK